MDIVSKVTAFIDKNSLIGNEEIIIGCSGGADSVALLRILNETYHQKLHVVHVNHNLRGEDAIKDEQFVLTLCRSLDIPCKAYSYDVTAQSQVLKRSLEDTGRILRYQAFNDYAKANFGEDYKDVSVIAVAHHKDDIAETMFMNLLRGSGADGLVSPAAKKDNVIRPLLCVDKSEIIAFLDSINQEYRTDITNFEMDCTRNVWRNDILPRIREISNKNPSDALFSTYELLADDVRYLEKVTENSMERMFDLFSNTISLAEFAKEDRAIQSRIIRQLWLKTFGNMTDLERVHVEAIQRLFKDSKSSGVTIDLPFERVAFVVDGRGGVCSRIDLVSRTEKLFVSKGYVFESISSVINISEIAKSATEIPQIGCELSARIVENISELEYNCYSWFCPIFEGDEDMELVFGPVDLSLKFGRAGSGSHKEVQRLLMDRKIPLWLRNRVFGVRRGDEILFIPGVGHSIGFTDEVSRVKFFESIGESNTPEKYLVLTKKQGG